MNTSITKRILIVLPVAFVLLSYQNCSTGFDSATGPKYDSNGNLIPPPGFSKEASSTSPGEGTQKSQTASIETGTAATSGIGNDEPGSYSSSSGDVEDTSENSATPGRKSQVSGNHTQCLSQRVSSKERAKKTANAVESAKRFLQSRRCNAFLSGPNGQARQFLSQASIANFCASDFQNTMSVLRQVGRMAGMQDIDQHNAVEKWIDCFCNVSGKSVCPELKAKRAKDIFDIQDHFTEPKYRRPAMKLESLPKNDDEVAGVDEILNE